MVLRIQSLFQLLLVLGEFGGDCVMGFEVKCVLGSCCIAAWCCLAYERSRAVSHML